MKGRTILRIFVLTVAGALLAWQYFGGKQGGLASVLIY
jgi:hypothetical protein